jgi:hypothetical protein
MSLLYKPIESITAADLEALISNQVGENLYLEYKAYGRVDCCAFVLSTY